MFREHKLFILDWDDTVFPTSQITNGEFKTFNEKDIIESREIIFDSIDGIACHLLAKMSKQGFVSIITNASQSWFEKSLSYFKHLAYAIEEYGVSVYTADSAKSAVKRKQGTLEEAKNINFKNALEEMMVKLNLHLRDNDSRKPSTQNESNVNIISIGDQDPECEAAFQICSRHSYVRARCLKLIPFPVVDFIEYQLNWIKDRLTTIAELDKKFEIIEVLVDEVPSLKITRQANSK